MEEIVAGLTRDQLTFYIGVALFVLIVAAFLLPRVFSGRDEGTGGREAGSDVSRASRDASSATPITPELVSGREGSVGAWVLTTPETSRNRIWYSVPEGENWVTTLFSRAFRVLGPGLNATIPYFEVVGARVPMRIFRVDLEATDLNARSSGEVSEPDVMIRIDTVCFGRIVDPMVVAYDLEISRNPDDPRLVSINAVRDYIRETIVARLRRFTAPRTIDELMRVTESDILELVHDIQQVLSRFGIRISNFQISQPIPSDELLEARAQVAITRARTEAGLIEAEREKRMAELRAEGLAAGITTTFEAIHAAIGRGLSEGVINALIESMVAQFALSEERGGQQAQPIVILGGGRESSGATTLGVLVSKMERIERALAARAGADLTKDEVRAILQNELADLLPPPTEEIP